MFAFVQSLAIKLTTFVKGAKFSNYLVLVAVLSSATSPIVVVVGIGSVGVATSISKSK